MKQNAKNPKQRKKLSSKNLRKHPVVGRMSVSLIRFLGGRSQKWQHVMADAGGKLLYYLPSKAKHVTQKNLDICFPDLSSEQKTALCKKSLYYVCRQAMAMCDVWENQAAIEQQITAVHGFDAFEKAIKDGDSVILAAPHVGNWELLNYFISHVYPGVGLYKEIRIQAVDEYVRAARESYGSKFMEATPKNIRDLLRALKNKTPVYILPDQQPSKNNGVFASFYNHPAYTMTLVSRLADKTNARVFGGFAKFTKEGAEIYFIQGDNSIRGSDEKSATALNKLIEKCISYCPEQYAWSYKRFQRQSGDVSIYR